MNNINHLENLPQELKYLLSAFLISLSIGILMGLSYVYMTTDMKPDGITERYNGSDVKINEIPENYPKPIENMILTTHNHLIMFSIISILLGYIFYHNSIINGWAKTLIILEPFIGTIIMFGALWLMRYVNPSFNYLVALSSIITYTMWFLMIMISLFNLNKK